ncbi:hypothetical protein Tco_1107342 [Tanacetum coccineum]
MSSDSEDLSSDSNSSSISSNSIEYHEWESRVVQYNQRTDRILEDVIINYPNLVIQDQTPRARRAYRDREREQGWYWTIRQEEEEKANHHFGSCCSYDIMDMACFLLGTPGFVNDINELLRPIVAVFNVAWLEGRATAKEEQDTKGKKSNEQDTKGKKKAHNKQDEAKAATRSTKSTKQSNEYGSRQTRQANMRHKKEQANQEQKSQKAHTDIKKLNKTQKHGKLAKKKRPRGPNKKASPYGQAKQAKPLQ